MGIIGMNKKKKKKKSKTAKISKLSSKKDHAFYLKEKVDFIYHFNLFK